MANQYLGHKDGVLRYMTEEEGNLCLVNTRLLMLREGSIIFDGFDEEIRQSQDEYIQKFLA
jgi:hypothetical protein